MNTGVKKAALLANVLGLSRVPAPALAPADRP